MPGITHLEGSHDRRFPCFEPPLQLCPTSTFRSFVKQLKPSMLSLPERNFLNAAFGGFLTGSQPPGNVHALLASITPHVFHENRLPRRYDGDRTLPHGRYYTVCNGEDGDDGGTLGRELMFYKDSRIAEAHIEIYDPVVPRQREMIDRLGLDASARERLVLRLIPFAQPPYSAVPLSISLSLPVKIQEVCVDNVLDLRRPAALDWLFRTVPKLHFFVNDKAEKRACFPFRKELSTFAALLPSMLDQQRGGGNFDKLVGLYLRQLGVSGLVFPSARSDANVRVVHGELESAHGWSFLDYRDAPPQEIVAFFELRPEWPSTLMLEGGDDHVQRPATFANEFQIVMSENFPSKNGGFAFRGVEQRIEAHYVVDSLEAAVRFRLQDLNDEQMMALKTFLVSLGSRDCSNFSAMVLWSLLGLIPARSTLKTILNDQLRENPIAGLLVQCTDPPPADEEQLSRSGAFYAIFQGPTKGDPP